MTDPILLASDGSQVAGWAADEASRLARALGAPVQAVYVADTEALRTRSERLGRDVEGRSKTLLERGRSTVEEAANRVRKHDVPVEAEVIEGVPAEAIVEHADQVGAQLIAMGTHHRDDRVPGALGSVADRVLRTAHVPVMTVRDEPRRGPRDPYERLLVPTDGSQDTQLAAEIALDLAKATGAALEFVFVIPPEIEDLPFTGEAEDLEQEALDPLRRRADDAGVPYDTATTRGEIHEGILDRAESSDVDATVIATQGWGSANEFWLGSVADKVVRGSRRPVITVHAPGLEG